MGHKIKMLIEVDFGEDLAFSPDDPESAQRFGQEVLMHQADGGALHLIQEHRNGLSDTVGRVRVLAVHDWPPSNR
jgi:hypothetical protein